MDIDVFSADELDGVFRVLRTALNPSGPLQPGEKRPGWTARTVARDWSSSHRSRLCSAARVSGRRDAPMEPLAADAARPGGSPATDRSSAEARGMARRRL